MAEIIKKSTNTIRLQRMFDIVNEVQNLDFVVTTYLKPLFDEVRERVQVPVRKKDELMMTLRQLALDEGIDPEFKSIQIDTTEGTIKYITDKPVEAKEPAKKTTKKKTAKKKAVR